MILVHLSKSWPDVLNGKRAAEDITLGEWALVSDSACEEYGDVILGIHKNTVVTAFDITGWTRNPADGRVTFGGKTSKKWAHLVGDVNPGSAWVRGQARPVQYLDTNAVLSGTVETETLDDGVRRAVVGDFTITVNPDGAATVVGPPGSSVTVISKAA